MKKILIIVNLLLCITLFSEEKYALVIGNSSYDATPLDNTINDAYDVSSGFLELGYNVTTIIDANRQTMESAVSNISESLTIDSMIVFYYAGHAAQVDNSNYLIPVNESINSENDLKYKGVNLNWILGEFKSSLSRTNVVILDSCRDNPFKDVSRGVGSRGLRIVSVPSSTGLEIKNSAIIYATTDGNTADDGDGRNSPFTTAFLNNMKRENETILDVMTYVTQEVFISTGGKQEPTMTNALKEKVYFTTSGEMDYNKSESGSIVLYTEISGDLYINGQYIRSLKTGETREFVDFEFGSYSLEFVTEDYSELVTVDIVDSTIIPVNFRIQDQMVTDIELKSLLTEKKSLLDRKEYIILEISDIEDQIKLHRKYSDKRDSQKRIAGNTGLIGFLSYIGAGISAYYAYENYQNYQNYRKASISNNATIYRDNTSGLLIATGAAALSGIINSAISSTNSDSVKKYDIQEDLFLSRLKKSNSELKLVKRDYDHVIFLLKKYE